MNPIIMFILLCSYHLADIHPTIVRISSIFYRHYAVWNVLVFLFQGIEKYQDHFKKIMNYLQLYYVSITLMSFMIFVSFNGKNI